jgi:hypothetical protein
MNSNTITGNTEKTSQTCLCCARSINGRSDKKFCNANCRNEYHNKRSGKRNAYMRRVNAILNRNRKLLLSFLSRAKQTTTVERSVVLAAGFSFTYCTQVKLVRQNLQYYCYDVYYIIQDEINIVIYRAKQ